MKQTQPGERVFAVLSSDDKTVELIGFGKYVGDETPPGHPLSNPKIVLDNGEVVWGMQCWWGPAHEYARLLGKRTEVPVPAPQFEEF